jgi:ribonuclease G
LARSLLINCRTDQRRVALIVDGVTTELFVEPLTDRGSLHNVYKGRVVRVLPGMQACFVEVGLSRTGYLYVGDIVQGGPGDDLPKIQEVVREGQEVLVQVSKEPIASKGARLTTHIALPGRHLVYTPTVEHVGVSRRIDDPQEKARLKALGQRLKPARGGLIIRTVAEGLTDEALAEDLRFLLDLWTDIDARAQAARAPALLYEDLDVTLRVLRDLMTDDLDRIVTDDPAEAERIEHFLGQFLPRWKGKVEVWEAADPLFGRFGLDWELSRVMRRRVWLRSGGHIVIDPTEAATVIDVNSGKHVGSHDLEETFLEVNLEAVREIAYQLRLRDIGGLIIIDFIDMTSAENRDRVHRALVEALQEDRARTHVLPISELGIVEMTRKRVRESLVSALTEPCFYCDGTGYLKAVRIIADEVMGRLRQMLMRSTGQPVVMAHPRVIERLVEDFNQELMRLEQRHGTEIQLVAKDELHLEQVEIK